MAEKRKSAEKPSKTPTKKAKLDANDKPGDWKKYKEEKKDLKIKRKQTKNNFDVITRAKKLGETLRRKRLKNGADERNRLVNELHGILKKDENYGKFVLAHDTSRIVQWLLKYSSPTLRAEIFRELRASVASMMQSKYGVFCVKRLLKYGTAETRAEIVKSFYGSAVKLASHALSAPYLEYAYATWATPRQKLHLVQEFYGDLYKSSKDDQVKCLKDVFERSPNFKTAALSATKANLNRILNKSLLDSSLVQTVLYQFLINCSADDRAELISQLASHVVVISNSKDGARAAMQCIWHGTNKDRKVIMKSVKEHLVELCKHEHGHCTVITLLDAIDDTVLLNKIVIAEVLNNAKDLSLNEWGRKVLLWLIVPGDSTYFHPQFIKELNEGRDSSASKKTVEIRRSEILAFSSATLLDLIVSEPQFWLSDSKVAYEMLAIIKSAVGQEVDSAYQSLARAVVDPCWKLKDNDKEVIGVEHAAMHLVLKKILQHDKINLEKGLPTFGAALIDKLTDETIETWITTNRGCFLLVLTFENGAPKVQEELKSRLKTFKTKLKNNECKGAQILFTKIK